MISTPWAILLCKFNDDTSPPPHPRKYYEGLFTRSDPGSMSMIDFFRTMSHGKLDLRGSRIFPDKEIGWLNVDVSYADYRRIRDSPGCGGVNDPDPAKRPKDWRSPRNELYRWAIEAATKFHPDWSKFRLSEFFGVTVVYKIGAVDTFGSASPPHAVCDEYTVKPSVLGQEMAHGYGLTHSKADGSEAEYQDPWDVMSNLNAQTAGHPEYDIIGEPVGLTVCDNNSAATTYGQQIPAGQTRGMSVGPGLNAAIMDNTFTNGESWIDDSRVIDMPSGKSTVVLRPLHHLELDGNLAIRVDRYYIEFRMNTEWDAGFPSPVVLVHYFADNHSYIVRDAKGDFGFTKGSVFSKRRGVPRFYTDVRIEVLDIDATKQTATISVEYSKPTGIDLTLNIPEDVRIKLPWEVESPAIPYFVNDLTIVNEKIMDMPNWSLRSIVKSLADISSAERFKNQNIRKSIRKESLESIIKIASEELSHLEHVGGVAHQHDSKQQTGHTHEEHEHDN